MMEDKSRLLQIIDNCAALSPAVLRRVHDYAKDRLSTVDISDIRDDKGLLFLRQIFDQYRFMISSEHFDKLKATSISVLSLPICNALADPSENEIIIFDGFIQAIGYRLEVSILVNAIRKHLPTLSLSGACSEQDFKSDATQATLMPLHFMINGNPLPRFTNELSDKLRRDAFAGLCGMLLFSVFHELGHIVLGHRLDSPGGRLDMFTTLVFTEQMNRFKAWEFDADQFAYEAIRPEARSVFIVNAILALEIFAEFESMSGLFGDMHPLTINRLSRLRDITGRGDDAIDGYANTVLQQMQNLMGARISQPKHPKASSLSRDQCAAIYTEALQRVLGSEDECRRAVDNLVRLYRILK